MISDFTNSLIYAATGAAGACIALDEIIIGIEMFAIGIALLVFRNIYGAKGG